MECIYKLSFSESAMTNEVLRSLIVYLISFYFYFLQLPAVTALQAIKGSLTDPFRNINNWRRGDPCVSNWTGVLCYNITLDDGYLHVREL